MTGGDEHRDASFPAVIPNVVRNLQFGKRREAVQSSRRFLVAALLGMTKKGALLGMTKKGLLGMTGEGARNVPFPAVIPNAVRNLQFGKRREAVQSSRRFLVAALLGMTKKGALLGMTGGDDHRDAPFPVVIPNVVRNLQLGKRREAVQSSRRFLVAALLGMTKKGHSSE
jgi:hypothetical protein